MRLRMSLMLLLNSFFLEKALAVDSTTHLNLDLPVLDSPFNFANRGSFPSMQQSLVITKGFYRFSHLGISKFIDPYSESWWTRLFGRLSILTYDVLTDALPPASAWLHEEWHRAVMSEHDIDSYNGVYDFNGGGSIPVRKVKDEDLENLKKDHPEDFVRLSAAGFESQYELSFAFEKDIFFHDTHTWDYAQIFLNYADASSYMGLCASNAADKATEDSEDNEGTDISKRDFTGLDCTAWAYDLDRPDEPYSDRGIHPSGVGIRRYIRFSDLDQSEQTYLKKQNDLLYLNYLDPFLLGFNGFHWGSWLWNSTVRHHLTSFGTSTDLNIFLRKSDFKLLTILHAYSGKARIFPGFEIQLIDRPFLFFERSFFLTPRFMIWQQPEDQLFASHEGVWGALLSLRASYLTDKKLSPFVELEAKTQGWVAGIVYTSRSFATRIGVIWNRI